MGLHGSNFTKVLLVEDDQDDRDLIREVLIGKETSRFGTYFVEGVATTEEARRLARIEQHDLYLVDYYLNSSDPHDTGLHFIEDLFSQSGHPPVVLLSGRDEFKLSADALRWVASGHLAFVHKSELNSDTLFSAIDRLLGRFVRLLLVEDDQDDFEMAKYHLSLTRGYRFAVHWAKTLEEARLLMEEFEFDGLLVDYKLGAERGTTLIRELVESGATTPLVLFTGAISVGIDENTVRMLGRRQMEFLSKQELSSIKIVESLRRAGVH